jgi:hypothetical protein
MMEEANDGMIIDTTYVDWNQETSRFLPEKTLLNCGYTAY